MLVRSAVRAYRPIQFVTLVLALVIAGSMTTPGCTQQTQEFTPAQALTSTEWPQKAPELIGADQDWLNTNGKALSIRDLVRTHHIIVVDFWEYTCVNCLRTLPYIKEWNRRYARAGLVIIGIHTPEFRFAHDQHNVETAVKQLGIDWPVLVDSDYKNWSAFRNNFWPRHFFIDMHGNIVADHAGEGDYAESERTIQRLLQQARPNLDLPAPLAPLRGEDAPGARCYPMTAEIYAGGRGFQQGQLANMTEYIPGETANYAASSGELQDGRIYLVGNWRTEEESLRHGRETADLADRVLLQYHAIEANAVIKPEAGKPLRVYVTQDHRPVSRASRGDDIRYDSAGNSFLLVDQPRMYRIVKNARYSSHLITLASRSADFGLYSFTFTSCEEK